jgi:indole-3-glycerol phosphate synthase/phosphoribosylanthranilate isomerase
VSRAQAREISGSTPLWWVGVFVNAPAQEVVETALDVGLSAVQLHGEETRDEVRGLRDLLPPGIEIWKAVRIKDRIPLLEETGADRLLLDTWRGDRRGGTGERFDWSLLASYPDKHRAVLSGGLSPEVAAAAEATGCWGLDVNSGVEERPGIKSHERLRDFFAARRGTGRSRQG